MSNIYAESIAVNRNAPQDVSSIDLYGYNGLERLTVAQLVNAVTIRRAAVVERQSVVQMNLIAVDAAKITNLSEGADWVITATTTDWPKDAVGGKYYTLLNDILNGNIQPKTTIPTDLTSEDNRREAKRLIEKAKANPGNQSNLAMLNEALVWLDAPSTASVTDWRVDPKGARYYSLLDKILNANTEPTAIPTNLSTYDNRMTAFELFKTQLDNANSSVDRVAVDLQTSVSRRDLLYNISTTICSRAFGAMNDMAVKMN